MIRNLALPPAALTRHWPVRLWSIVAGAMVVVAATVVWLGVTATVTIDETALTRQRSFAVSALDELLKSIPKDQESVTIWDDTVLRLNADDQRWMEENVGVWMADYFGHDAAFVLGSGQRPIHAMLDGETHADAAAAWAVLRATVEPLAVELRADMAAASTGLTDSTAAIAGLGVTDFVLLDEAPAVVSIKPILSDTGRVPQRPGAEFLHVAIERLDGAVADAIASEYLLDGARFVPATENRGATAPATTRSGTVIARLTWDPYRPGQVMLQRMGPVLAVAAFGVFLLVVWLLEHVWRSTKRLDDLAHRDVLTGLPNRVAFEEQLRRVVCEQRRREQALSILLLDIDQFKNVNDTLGHQAGDELVRQMGRRLFDAASRFGSACVARLGGDEFAIVISHHAGSDVAASLAQYILLEMSRPFSISDQLVHSSVSIGIKTSNATSPDPDNLIRHADIALYDAKAQGRGRYAVFSPQLDEIVLRRRSIELDLLSALDRHQELDVVYQPIFDAEGETIVGAEALVRWNHPVHGPMSPSVFVGIAEERGLIDRLGWMVLEHACAFLSDSTMPWIAVNVSAAQLRDRGFAARVRSLLRSYNVDPSRLQVEITETLLIDDSLAAQAVLTELRSAGVAIVLDDFGTGYSSLSYLRQYGIDKLKIDRSFVQPLGTSPEAEAIVRAIVALARAMKRRVTAEGVETIQQMDHLAAMGCHELQGFLLSVPVAAAVLRQRYLSQDAAQTLADVDSAGSRSAVSLRLLA